MVPISEQRIVMRLPKEMRLKMEQAAKKRRLTISGLARLAISEWLDAQTIKEKLEKDISRQKK